MTGFLFGLGLTIAIDQLPKLLGVAGGSGTFEIRTILSRYSLAGEGLCIGYDGGDAVSSEYTPKFEFTDGRIVKVVFDVADDAYVDVERELEAAMARD